MTQQFTLIPETEKLTDSRARLNNALESVQSNNAGGTFPTTNLYNGMLFWHSGERRYYELLDKTVPAWAPHGVYDSDGNVTFDSMVYAGGEITPSSAALQVNGFQRTGTIYLHEGATPKADVSRTLGNVAGELQWGDSKIWHDGNHGPGSGLNADTVDGIHGSALLKHDGSVDLTGRLTGAGRIDPVLLRFGTLNLVVNPAFHVDQLQYGSNPPSLPAGAYGHDGWFAGSAGCAYGVIGNTASIQSGSLKQIIEGRRIPITGTYCITWAGGAALTVDGTPVSKGGTVSLGVGTDVTLEWSGGGVGEVTLCYGSDPVPYALVARDYVAELDLCWQYYYRIWEGNNSTFGTGNAIDPNVAQIHISTPRPMRDRPTVRGSNGTDDFGCYYKDTNAGGMWFDAALQRSRKGALIKLRGATGMTAGESVQGYITANNGGWIEFDCRM